MRIEEITPEALKLSVHERAALASSLWESIEGSAEFATVLSEEDAIALSIQRDREIESGEVIPLSHEEVMKRLRGWW